MTFSDNADDDTTTRSDTGAETTSETTRAQDTTPFTQQLGRILVAVIVVFFAIFAVVNAQYVEFNWVFGDTEVVEQGGERVSGGVPLIVLLVASFVLGALAGWFATWRSHRHRDRGEGSRADAA